MIIGLGSDLCDIRRIEKTLERFGDRFVGRKFMPRSSAMECRVTPITSHHRLKMVMVLIVACPPR